MQLKYEKEREGEEEEKRRNPLLEVKRRRERGKGEEKWRVKVTSILGARRKRRRNGMKELQHQLNLRTESRVESKERTSE